MAEYRWGLGAIFIVCQMAPVVGARDVVPDRGAGGAFELRVIGLQGDPLARRHVTAQSERQRLRFLVACPGVSPMNTRFWAGFILGTARVAGHPLLCYQSRIAAGGSVIPHFVGGWRAGWSPGRCGTEDWVGCAQTALMVPAS